MATQRLTMRQTREILRHKWLLGRSHRQIAQSLGVSLGIVSKTAWRAQAAGLGCPDVQALSEIDLEARLYGQPRPPHAGRPLPDGAWIHTELRKPGVTLQLLHLEYLEQYPDGYRYTQFCEHYRRWLRRQGVVLRQIHRGGEKLFVDYSGKRPSIIDPHTGEVRPVELFAAVLGASDYTYAEATLTQRLPDWIGSHTRAFAFFGGVPGAVVCDQLKSGVALPCRYEPGLQWTYEEFLQHYGTVGLPARPHRPRDKAKAEVGIQVVQRWILARLRHESFFSLEALNARIAELLVALDAREMRKYGASRRALFERLDQPYLRPLPAQPFVYGEWKVARVNVDSHIEVRGHYYSVPHRLLQEAVDVRSSATSIEVFHRGVRVASHRRSDERGRHTTVAEHLPKAHQQHLEWSPSRILGWAERVGPHTRDLAAAILAERPHPEQGYRSCLGLVRLERRYGADRVEAACARALAAGARSYRHVDAILKHGLDCVPPPTQTARARPEVAPHEHVRGPAYYHTMEGRRSDAPQSDLGDTPRHEARCDGACLGSPTAGPGDRADGLR
jgi:transposase